MADETLCGDAKPLKEPFHTLISAAILAPSGDNMQPWRFEIDEAETTITVCVDETRDTSPMNAGQRMARIACGAAIENILRTARHNDWKTCVELHDSPTRLADISVSGDFSVSGIIETEIQDRHTNRRPYDGLCLADPLLDTLKRAIKPAIGTTVRWITDRDELYRYAHLIGRADAAMFGEPEFLRAFLENVRSVEAVAKHGSDGLPLDSLALSPFERLLFPLLKHFDRAILRSWPMRQSIARKARRLVSSSSGLCLIDSNCYSPRADVTLGQTMQQAWLALTQQRLQVQPMMSIPVLASASAESERKAELFNGLLSDVANDSIHSTAGTVPTAILRFGRAAVAANRTGRRHLTLVARPKHPCFTFRETIPQLAQ